MPKYGLIGYPIAHSLSPRLFGAAYGGRFRYDLLEYESFDEAFRVFQKSYDAVNVTAPFKEQAFERARIRSRECELIGAANILVKTPRGLSCFNSDCSAVKVLIDGVLGKASGFSSKGPFPIKGTSFTEGSSFTEEASAPEGKKAARALVVGCGGAGKAAIVAAAQCGLEVTVMNRNISRALNFTQSLNLKLPGAGISGSVKVLPIENFLSALSEADILIYTAPAPLDCFQSLGDLPSGARLKVILEANYRNPSFTPEVLSHLPEAADYIPGQQWLLQQALTGYKLMTGQSPDSGALLEVF